MSEVEADLMLCEAEHVQRDGLPLAGGMASVYTARSPLAEGVNQDVVTVMPANHTAAVVMVADGAGGLPSGALAARIAAEQMRRSLSALNGDDDSVRLAILDGIEKANRDIMETHTGGATTLEVVLIRHGTIRCFHVGDSVTMLVGGRGKLKFRTVSHSPVGYAVESGLVDEHDALFSDELHLVSNFLGMPDFSIEIGPVVQMAPRDTLLVATDGLSDNMHAGEMIEFIRKGPLEQATEALSQPARERMLSPRADEPSKPDDLSFVLYRQG